MLSSLRRLQHQRLWCWLGERCSQQLRDLGILSARPAGVSPEGGRGGGGLARGGCRNSLSEELAVVLVLTPPLLAACGPGAPARCTTAGATCRSWDPAWRRAAHSWGSCSCTTGSTTGGPHALPLRPLPARAAPSARHPLPEPLWRAPASPSAAPSDSRPLPVPSAQKPCRVCGADALQPGRGAARRCHAAPGVPGGRTRSGGA